MSVQTSNRLAKAIHDCVETIRQWFRPAPPEPKRFCISEIDSLVKLVCLFHRRRGMFIPHSVESDVKMQIAREFFDKIASDENIFQLGERVRSKLNVGIMMAAAERAKAPIHTTVVRHEDGSASLRPVPDERVIVEPIAFAEDFRHLDYPQFRDAAPIVVREDCQYCGGPLPCVRQGCRA